MKGVAFIHGSSVGQSTFIPADAPQEICQDLAGKYFRGRVGRSKESGVQLALFVDLYKSPANEIYCVYSFLNNDCLGAKVGDERKGRDGQYFAISVMCKDVYFYPDMIYQMLYSAYSQMVETKKILSVNRNDDKEQYLVRQFDEQAEYLSAFLRLIEENFDRITAGGGIHIDKNACAANYDSWHGQQVSIDDCNSWSAYRSLCTTGRLYVSEKYESYVNKCQSLLTANAGLHKRVRELEAELAARKPAPPTPPPSPTIKELQRQIDGLQQDNNDYKAAMSTISAVVEKRSKAPRASRPTFQEKVVPSVSDGFTSGVKNHLLWVILLLTIFTCILSLCILRKTNTAEDKGANQPVSQNTAVVDEDKRRDDDNQETGNPATYLTISPQSIKAEADGDIRNLTIDADGTWELPRLDDVDWIHLQKTNKGIEMTISRNDSPDSRTYTFLIMDQQVSIFQPGKMESVPSYGMIVKDIRGMQLKSGAHVRYGQTLIATVTTPELAEGFGWRYSQCSGPTGNVKSVRVKITGHMGEAVIAYGNLKDGSQRERFNLIIESESRRSPANTTHSADTINS